MEKKRKNRRILFVGGGSGGHIVPLVSVLKKIKEKDSRAEVQFWTDKGVFFEDVQKKVGEIDSSVVVRTVLSGKVRRFSGWTFSRYLRNPKVLLANVVDFLKMIGGFFQSLYLLIRWRPDVIFTKGGYVSLPVGLAARALFIPYVIHESDVHFGLANRLLMRGAREILLSTPVPVRNKFAHKMRYVGIPIAEEFSREYSDKELREIRKELGLNLRRPVVLVIGGSLGAKRVNDAFLASMTSILEKANIVLVTGRDNFDGVFASVAGELTDFERISETQVNFGLEKGGEFAILSYTEKMYELMKIADVIVSRAGATAIAEIAASISSGAATILVPHTRLPGGHQMKNAEYLEKRGAAIIVDNIELNDNIEMLGEDIIAVLEDTNGRQKMAKKMRELAETGVVDEIAEIVYTLDKK